MVAPSRRVPRAAPRVNWGSCHSEQRLCCCYADAPKEDVPREILVPVEPDDRELYEELLSLNRDAKVRIRVPQRGGKKELLQTAMLNARESFARHKLRR